GVRTAIARDALLPPGADRAEAAARARDFERNLRLAPEKAAEIIVEGALRRAPRVLVGGDAKLISLIQRLAPAGHWRLVERLMARKPAGAPE
ncbi:MAG: short-chain dehydrogenase, partial [Paracoccaceae bacterium]